MMWGFGSVDTYMNAQLRPSTELLKDVPEFERVTQSYERLARRGVPGSNRRTDGRALSIEIATHQHVRLADVVDQVVIPEAMIESGDARNTHLLQRLSALNIEYVTDEWARNRTSRSFKADIESIVKDLHRVRT